MTVTSRHTASIIKIGDTAPDFALTDTEGKSVELSDFWTQKPTVIVFLRHFGCTFCREHVADLRRDYAAFQKAGAEVLCIGQGDYKTGKAFSIYFMLPFPLLVCGDDTSVFRAYGLERGTKGQLFGLPSIIHGLAATLRGHINGKIVGDGMQMPGVFIVDKSGVIRFAHRHRHAGDNPDNKIILKALTNLAPGEPNT